MVRSVVLKHWNGLYVGREASLVSKADAVVLTEAQAYQFLSTQRRRGRNDLFHMTSMEMLPKRRRHPDPLTAEEFAVFQSKLSRARLLEEADKYDRMSAGYLIQADHAKRSADAMREKAQQLRKAIEC